MHDRHGSRKSKRAVSGLLKTTMDTALLLLGISLLNLSKKQIRTHYRKEIRSDLRLMVHHRGLEPRTH